MELFGYKIAGKVLMTIIFGLAVLMLVGAIVWAIFLHPAELKKEAATAKVDSAYSAGTAASAEKALKAQQDNTNTKASIDAGTKANSDDILQAPGAIAPLDPALDGAGLRAQCMRSLYHNTPRCRKLLGTSK